MKRTLLAAALGIMTIAVPLTGPALVPAPAHAAGMMHATLQLSRAYKHNMYFAHTMASAALSYTKHDVTVKVTASHLPKPSVVRAMAYVVWLTDGSMKERAGSLMVHGGMASLKAMVMMTKVQDVVVTAEHSSMPAHPMGPVVLSGMVG